MEEYKFSKSRRACRSVRNKPAMQKKNTLFLKPFIFALLMHKKMISGHYNFNEAVISRLSFQLCQSKNNKSIIYKVQYTGPSYGIFPMPQKCSDDVPKMYGKILFVFIKIIIKVQQSIPDILLVISANNKTSCITAHSFNLRRMKKEPFHCVEKSTLHKF